MSKIDKLLGEARTARFADAIESLLRHNETSVPGVCKSLSATKVGAEVCSYLICAATEFETAWNTLRLANIPAMHRNARVASELVAMAVLNAIPIQEIRSLGDNLKLPKLLRKYETINVLDLFKPRVVEKPGREEVQEPRLQAHECYATFIAALENILKIKPEIVKNLKEYRKAVHHSSSHATHEVFSYHFEGFTGERAGAFYDPAREKSYLLAADDLIDVVKFNVYVLNTLSEHIAGRNNRG
jgi:hypothetical protein